MENTRVTSLIYDDKLGTTINCKILEGTKTESVEFYIRKKQYGDIVKLTLTEFNKLSECLDRLKGYNVLFGATFISEISYISEDENTRIRVSMVFDFEEQDKFFISLHSCLSNINTFHIDYEKYLVLKGLIDKLGFKS